METETFYPSANLALSKGNNYPAGGAYSVLHDATDASGNDVSAQTVGVQIRGGNVSNQFDNMVRTGFVFDTSSLGSGVTISSVVFSIVSYAKEETIASQSVSVVGFTPANEASLANADYDQFGTTLYASDVSISSITADGTTYTDFTFNASGIAAINKTGNTCIGIRMRSDVDNSAPTWASNTNGAYIGIQTIATTSIDKDPKLVIEYSTGSTPQSTLALLGVG